MLSDLGVPHWEFTDVLVALHRWDVPQNLAADSPEWRQCRRLLRGAGQIHYEKRLHHFLCRD